MNVLISVSDKRGIAQFAKSLQAMGAAVYSTGGSAALLRENGVKVTSVSDYTSSPELFDGRVKTLHPKIFGGILAMRSKKEHAEQMKNNGIVPFDMVIVNLYPFEETAGRQESSFQQVIEDIDIGGVSLIRAAAKNFEDVAVVTNPSKYELIEQELKKNGVKLSREFRMRLACEAFEHTARYDDAIYRFFKSKSSPACAGTLPQRVSLTLKKCFDLRYGENSHQKAALYTDCETQAPLTERLGTQLHGKELSYNNILDMDAAVSLVKDLCGPYRCAIIKHNNPCGAAVSGKSLLDAYKRAFETDPLSAFGGIIACNCAVDEAFAGAVNDQFAEVISAPAYDEAALAALKTKKNLRIITIPSDSEKTAFDLRSAAGCYLLQEKDLKVDSSTDLTCVTKAQAGEQQLKSLLFAAVLAKHVRSNAVVLVSGMETAGIGAGQMSRIDSVKIAVQKSRKPLAGAVAASDAFFPFRDSIDELAKHGIKAVIQPGGSLKDNEVIAACDEHGIAMYTTGFRHFRH